MIFIFIWTDEDLQRINLRDPDAFEKLYNKYKVKIYNYLIIKVNGDKDVAEEILSDTIYSALVSAPNLKDQNKILGWLLQIANRRFLDYLRNKYRESEKNEDSFDENSPGKNNVVEEIHEKEKVVLMNLALDKIKPKYSKLLRLKYYDDKSQKEIAKILKKSVSSVESLLFRAREALKKELKVLYKD